MASFESELQPVVLITIGNNAWIFSESLGQMDIECWHLRSVGSVVVHNLDFPIKDVLVKSETQMDVKNLLRVRLP